MTFPIRTAALAALAASAMLAASAQAATTIYTSANFVDEAVSGGDYFIDNTRYLGAVFSVGSTEQLSSIGGNFTLYGDGGAIFGAIVPVVGGLPGDVGSTAVAHTVFTPAGGDQSTAISGLLTPGTYAVVFGSGLYGATGYSGLVSGQTAVGTPSFVQFDSHTGTLTAGAFNDDTLRFTVTATPVPEPATALLWAAGALVLGVAGRRRSA